MIWQLLLLLLVLLEHVCDAGTLVEKAQDSTMIVNAEVDTLIESNLGTMIINDTDDDDNDDAAGADDSETMKRSFLFIICFYMPVVRQGIFCYGSICQCLSICRQFFL